MSLSAEHEIDENNYNSIDASMNSISLNSPRILQPEENDLMYELSENKEVIDTVEDNLPNAFHQPSINVSGILSQQKIKNFSRRVSFPDGDKIISGYGEPRNPWASAKGTSTEELIQAYTQSCQHWGVKPITKLLVQLQEISDFSIRTHSLTLKGEKLDSKVVETLEAVFKRVQFVIMDLEATNLDDDSAAALFDMIEYYESAVNVLIGFNRNFGTRGWQAAAHMMRKMSCLRLFDGHSVPLTEQAVPFVGRALRLSNTLVTLHLENAMLSGRPMLLIVAALRMNTTLRELFLADNRLLSTDALQIANLLRSNTILQLLDIRNNLIQDAGLCHICAGLMSQSQSHNNGNGVPGLQTLVLWNNQISHQSMVKLAMTLRHVVSLSTLNLGQNVLGDDGVSKLKEGLLQNHSLLRLGLVGAKLTCEGGIALAEFLAESPRIIRLDLRNNNIKVAGLMALSLAFRINYSLLRLDIDKPSSKDTELKELQEKQESLYSDILSYAVRNKENTLRRVLNLQKDRVRKTEDNSASGLRYMDMTNANLPVNTSVMQTKSINNSNNNLATSSDKLFASYADDSPINSPEFLPSNSVSYHQVLPVMYSSSEIEKRSKSNPAIEEVDQQTTSIPVISNGDTPTSIKGDTEKVTNPDQDDTPTPEHLSQSNELPNQNCSVSDEVFERGNTDPVVNQTTKLSESQSVDDKVKDIEITDIEHPETVSNNASENVDDQSFAAHESDKIVGKTVEVLAEIHNDNTDGADLHETDCGEILDDNHGDHEKSNICKNEDISDEAERKNTDRALDIDNGDSCVDNNNKIVRDVSTAENEIGDEVDIPASRQDEQNADATSVTELGDAAVTVSHYDLSLFPHS